MNQDLRQDLIDRYQADQQALSSLLESADEHRNDFDHLNAVTETPWPYAVLEWEPEESAPAVVRTTLAQVRGNTRALMDVVDAIGWPGRDVVGEDGADAAWLLLQHAGAGVRTLDSPANRDFRRRCESLLEVAVSQGRAHPRHLAHTTDGIRAVEGRAPAYAVLSTAFVSDEVGVRLAPGIDLCSIDRNRARIGLATVSEDLQARSAGREPPVVGGDRLEPWRTLRAPASDAGAAAGTSGQPGTRSTRPAASE